ncbi:MAG: hypothetical protein SF066_04575 [Thermoanaerobaculia bacterium]|nr:hypothetical protein [Thermoanaerobaculia bacterium]
MSADNDKLEFQVYHDSDLSTAEAAHSAARNLRVAVPIGWRGRVCGKEVEGDYKAIFHKDGDLTPCGIENGVVALTISHGSPEAWGSPSGYVPLSSLFLGDGGLRYGFWFGCNLLAHGPLVLGSSASDYLRPECFGAMPESSCLHAITAEDQQNVFERWSRLLSSEMRLVCGSSTLVSLLTKDPTEYVWRTIASGKGVPLSVSWIAGISSSPSEVPLCLARGESTPWVSSLVDSQFTKDAASHEYENLQILYPVWRLAPLRTSENERTLLEHRPEFPVFELGVFSEAEFSEVLGGLGSLFGVGENDLECRILGTGQAVLIRRRGQLEYGGRVLQSESDKDLVLDSERRMLQRLPGNRIRRGALGEVGGPLGQPRLPFWWKKLGQDTQPLSDVDEIWDSNSRFELRIDIAPDTESGRAGEGMTRWLAGGHSKLKRVLNISKIAEGRPVPVPLIPVLGYGGLISDVDFEGAFLAIEIAWRPLIGVVGWRRVATPREALEVAKERLAAELAMTPNEAAQVYSENEAGFEFGYKEYGYWVEQKHLSLVYRFEFVPRSGYLEDYLPRVIELSAFDPLGDPLDPHPLGSIPLSP